jgi:transposase
MARKRYSSQFKEEACRLVTEHGHTWKQAASKLGVGQSTFDYWMKQHGRLREGDVVPPDSDDPRVLRMRIRQLEKQLRESTIEKEILKKATVYFASLKK